MLEYLKYSERGYFMKNNVKEIMKEYKEGIEKIDNAYKVKKVEKLIFLKLTKKQNMKNTLLKFQKVKQKKKIKF